MDDVRFLVGGVLDGAGGINSGTKEPVWSVLHGSTGLRSRAEKRLSPAETYYEVL